MDIKKIKSERITNTVANSVNTKRKNLSVNRIEFLSILQNNEQNETLFKKIKQNAYKASKMVTVKLDDIPNSAFSWRGMCPYLIDIVSAICTANPIDSQGKSKIVGKDDTRTDFYTIKVFRNTAFDFGTDNDYTQFDYFLHEIHKAEKSAPLLCVKEKGGYVVTRPLTILEIRYKDFDEMTEQEKELCTKLGIAHILDYIVVAAYKPLFAACFPESRKAAGGFVEYPKAFYAKFHKAALKLNKTESNLNLDEKYITTYYSFALWFYQHLSSNEKSKTLTLDTEKIIELLQGIAPSQIYFRQKKFRLRNPVESAKLIATACKILNKMRNYEGSEYFKAIPEYCNQLQTENGLQLEIGYRTEKPHVNAKLFETNILQEKESA